MGNAGRGVDAAHGQWDEHDWRCCGGSEAYRQRLSSKPCRTGGAALGEFGCDSHDRGGAVSACDELCSTTF